jgi:hypothetical protein
MKKGIKIGPTRTHTAVAIVPKAITIMATAWAKASRMMMVQ